MLERFGNVKESRWWMRQKYFPRPGTQFPTRHRPRSSSPTHSAATTHHSNGSCATLPQWPVTGKSLLFCAIPGRQWALSEVSDWRRACGTYSDAFERMGVRWFEESTQSERYPRLRETRASHPYVPPKLSGLTSFRCAVSPRRAISQLTRR